MSEISPEPVNPPPAASSAAKRTGRRKLWFAGSLLLLALIVVAAWGFWPDPDPPTDAFLFNWQAMVDEQTADELVKQLAHVEMIDTLPAGVEATDSLRRWRMERDRIKSSSSSASVTTCYRGSGNVLRGIVSRANGREKISTSRELHWKQIISRDPFQSTKKNAFMDKISRLGADWSGHRDQGIFVSGCIDNEGNPNLLPRTSLTASGLYALTIGSRNSVRLHLYGGQVRYNTIGSAGEKFVNVPFGWNEALLPGDAIVMINRFPDVKDTPVLITVCERHDLLPSESLELIGTQLSTPQHWINGGPAFVSKTIQKINEFSSKAPPRPLPLPAPWTHALPDGTQVSLLALARPEKYPRTYWSPTGAPVVLSREIRDHLIVSYRSKSPLLGIVFVTYPASKAEHSSPVDFSRIIPYSTRFVNNVGLLWNNSWNKGIYNDSSVEVQFGAIPVNNIQDPRTAGIDLAIGYGDWKTLGTVRAAEDAQLADREVRIGSSITPFSNKNLIDVSVTSKLQSNEESSLVVIQKNGHRVLHCFPPPIHLPPVDGVLRHRRQHECFYNVEPEEIDCFEVRVRPTKTIHFSGFVIEPDSLKSSL